MGASAELLEPDVGEATEEVFEELPEMATAPVMAAEMPISCAVVSKPETQWKRMTDDGNGWLMMQMHGR